MTNRKRNKKKLPPLDVTCAFCRSPIHKNDSELMSRYEKRIEKGDVKAMLNLAKRFMRGSEGFRKDEAKASELFNRAADLGSAEAIGRLGLLAMDKEFTSVPNKTKAMEYFEDATKKGHVISRAALASLSAGEGEIELAIKHWQLAAEAGCDYSMKDLWDCFSKGKLSKPDLEKALRAHKAACDEMNSEERKRYDAAKEARVGNDEFLKSIYDMYYLGYINAKELKKSLKAHAAGDLRAVETFLANKIRTNR